MSNIRIDPDTMNARAGEYRAEAVEVENVISSHQRDRRLARQHGRQDARASVHLEALAEPLDRSRHRLPALALVLPRMWCLGWSSGMICP